jgi:ribosomal protein S18 acetylase RimI-like enzyme
VKLELSTIDQLNQILDLVNLAYRGEKGWTRETEIIEGKRATEEQIKSAIEDPSSHFLVYSENGNVLACVCVRQENDKAYIGLFAVHPKLQGKGIGKQALLAAEEYAAANLGAKKYVMVVVSQRPELISYYERRGYVRTGEIEQYPDHLGVGTPKTGGLTIEYLEKTA